MVRAESHYTFGDSDQAARRLTLLAAAYDRPTRAFLTEHGESGATAVDLGCGPGFTTELLHDAASARCTVGVDISAAHVARARSRVTDPAITFVQADLRDPEAVPAGDVVFGRFLLAHLTHPAMALRRWAGLLRPGGRLMLQETHDLISDEPALQRYYDVLAVFHDEYGQDLYVGRRLAELAQTAGLTVVDFRERAFQPTVAVMAELHWLNLRTWRRDPLATALFTEADLDDLEAALRAVVERAPTGTVDASLGELVAGAPR